MRVMEKRKEIPQGPEEESYLVRLIEAAVQCGAGNVREEKFQRNEAASSEVGPTTVLEPTGKTCLW